MLSSVRKFLISIVLAIFYFSLFTPLGIAIRVIRDPLQRKLRPRATSYMEPLAVSRNPRASANGGKVRSHTETLVTVQHQIHDAIDCLDAVIPIGQPLLWAARCSLEATALLLQADTPAAASGDRGKEIVLEALSAARAAVGAAAYACTR
jgi:hypothetical protein